MINIALFGHSKLWKGTQSKNYWKNTSLHIFLREICCEEIANDTLLSRQAKEVIEKGGLADDDIIVQIIENKIKTNPDTNGYLFDGFQELWYEDVYFRGLMLRMNTSLTSMICLEVPQDILIERLSNRAIRKPCR